MPLEGASAQVWREEPNTDVVGVETQGHVLSVRSVQSAEDRSSIATRPIPNTTVPHCTAAKEEQLANAPNIKTISMQSFPDPGPARPESVGYAKDVDLATRDHGPDAEDGTFMTQPKELPAAKRWAEVRATSYALRFLDGPKREPGTAERTLLQHEAWDVAETTLHWSKSSAAIEKNRFLKSILRDKELRSDGSQHDHSMEKNKAYQHALFQAGLAVPETEKRVKFNLSRSQGPRGSFFRRLSLPKIRSPSDHLVQYWNLAFIIPLAYEAWAFPFRLALGSPQEPGLFAADFACDLWFCLDALASCFIAVPDEPDLSRAELAWRYARRVLPLQILPGVVFLAVSQQGVSLGVWWALGVPRLTPRLHRLRRYFKSMEMNLDVDVDKLQLIKFTLVIFLSCHWVGCLYYWMARVMEFRDNTWVGQFEATMPGVFDRDGSPHEEHYLALLYRGWIGLAPNSYRRPPQNWPEQLFSVAVMFMAMYLSAYLIGTVLPYIVKKDPVAEQHKQRRGDFLVFATQHQLPQDLINRCLEYLEFQYTKRTSSAGLAVPLTRTLEVRVAKKMCGPFIERCSQKGQVFYKCDQAFIGTLVTKLREVYLMPGEVLIRAGDVARALYFVADGAIQLADNETVIKEVRGDVPDMPSVVGELSFFLGVPQRLTARASSAADARVLVLSMEDAERLLALYPEQQELTLRNILMEYSLDMHGNDLQAAAHEEGHGTGDEHVDLQRVEIAAALKRRDAEAFAALNFAAEMGDIEEVQRLIRRGCDVNACNYDGRTVLHMSCHAGNLRIVELLLDNGATMQAPSRWGLTPLMEAIYAKQHQCVHVMLNHKAEMSLPDPSGILCDWAHRGEVESLKLLLSNGVNPNVGDYDQRTPLHVAASEGQDKSVEILIAHGADVNAKDRWGGTPLKDAVVANHAVVASMLRHKGAELPPGVGAAEFCAGASLGDVAKLRMLHACGVNPDEGDYDDRRALHLACAEARLLVVSFLVGVSASINITDRWGATPLDECLKGGTRYHYCCGRILLGWGAKLGVLAGTEEGREGLERIHEIDIDEVSTLIRGLIASGLYDRRHKTASAQEVLVLREASMELIRDCGELAHRLEPAERAFHRSTAALQELGVALEDVLCSIASILDLHPRAVAYAILNSSDPQSAMAAAQTRHQLQQQQQQPPALGGKTPDISPTVGASVPRKRPPSIFFAEAEMEESELDSLEAFIASLDPELLDPEEVLKEELDESHAALYAELDELVAQQERREALGESGRQLTAKNLNHHLLALFGFEEALEKLDEVFRRFSCGELRNRHSSQGLAGVNPGSFVTRTDSGVSFKRLAIGVLVPGNPLVDAEGLVEVMAALGVDDVGEEEAEEMIAECEGHAWAEPYRATAWSLLASSSRFRARMNALDGDDVGGCERQFAFLSKCKVLASMPYSDLRRLAHDCEHKFVPKGMVVWRKGMAPSALYVVTSGAFAIEAEVDPLTRLRDSIEVSSESVLGAVEFYTGERLPYTIRAAQDSEVIQVAAGQVAAILESNPLLSHRMATAVAHLIKSGSYRPAVHSLSKETAAAEATSARKFDMSKPPAAGGIAALEKVMLARFHLSDVVKEESESRKWGGMASPRTVGWRQHERKASTGEVGLGGSVLLQDLRDGLSLVHESWELFGCGGTTAPVAHFRGIREHLGEVGTRFVATVFEVIANKEEVRIGDWWECWIRYLNSTQEMNASSKSSRSDAEGGTNGAEDAGSPHPLRMPGAWERLRQWLPRSRFRQLLLSPAFKDRYEQAYMDLKGNLTDSIAVEELPTFVALLVGVPAVEPYMMLEFLLLFTKRGAKTREVSWFGIRKVLFDRANKVQAAAEPLFMTGSSVFNPASSPIQGWFYLIRLVAIYHFVFVPVRLVYRPFERVDDLALLLSDGLADALVILHVLMSFNTAYVSKKSRWVVDRTKIAKKYLGSFCYLDTLSAFPSDWIMMALGMDLHRAEWTRVLKMVLMRVVWSGFAYNSKTPRGLGRLLLMAFMVLHLSACIWSGLGMADEWEFTRGGNTWLTAVNSEVFLEGMARGGRLTMWELYTTSLNWVATHTVSAIGNTTLYPKNYVEVLFAMFQLTIGMTFYRMVLGQISSIVMKQDEKIIRVRGQLGSLEGYIQKNKLHEDVGLSNEIRRHFHALQRLQIVDMAQVFSHLNHSLQFDISALICREPLEAAALFRGCSQSMLDRISVMLRQVQFGPEEELFQAGDVPEEMYLVVSGVVERHNVDAKGEEVAMGGTKAGGVVGEVSFAFGMKHLYGARAGAASGATCLRLARSSYLQVLKLYPEDADMVSQNSLNAFELAKVEHGSSKAGSRRGTSVHSADMDEMALQQTSEEDDMTIASDEEMSGSESEGSEQFEQLIGSGIAQHIQTLKTRQASTRVLQLLEAAHAGDTVKIEKLLGRGVSVNVSDPNQRTALHVASAEGQLETVRLLLEHGADTTVKDAHGNTALNDAVRHKQDSVASLIRELKPGSKVSFEGAMGAVQMCEAAFAGDLEQVRRLVANGMSVNEADYDSRTALHLAACEGHCPVVQLLVDAAADVNARDRFSMTALQDAVRHEQSSVQAVLRQKSKNIVGMDTAVSMCEAASEGNLHLIRTFVENGVEPNLPDYDLRTAMHLAAANGKVEVLNYLLELDPPCNVNPVDVTGGTPLEDALRHEQQVAAKMLQLAGGLRKGDAALAEQTHLQDAKNRLHAKEMRRPKVVTAFEQSRERHDRAALDPFLEQLADVAHSDARAHPDLLQADTPRAPNARSSAVAFTLEEPASPPGALARTGMRAAADPGGAEFQAEGAGQALPTCRLLERLDGALRRFAAVLERAHGVLRACLPQEARARRGPREPSASDSEGKLSDDGEMSMLPGAVGRMPVGSTAPLVPAPRLSPLGAVSAAGSHEPRLEEAHRQQGRPHELEPAGRGAVEREEEAGGGAEGRSSCSLADLLLESDALAEVLVTIYRELPALPKVSAVNSIFARRYRQGRAALMQATLRCIALSNRLRQLVRQNQARVPVLDGLSVRDTSLHGRQQSQHDSRQRTSGSHGH